MSFFQLVPPYKAPELAIVEQFASEMIRHTINQEMQAYGSFRNANTPLLRQRYLSLLHSFQIAKRGIEEAFNLNIQAPNLYEQALAEMPQTMRM